ncbi:MAG: hypothetical protein Q7S21_05235 [archaeon]|nr:hypothetical protein [archaeon]
MGKKTILITRPNHDSITHYLCEWNNEIINMAKEKNFDVHDLKAEKANKKETISHLEKQKYEFVILNGHGNANQIAGYNNEILIESGINHKLLNDKVTYAISCNAAKELGKKCCEDGAIAFIGYENDFVLFYEKNMISRPMQDQYAKAIIMPSNQISQTLIKGNDINEAIKRSNEITNQNIEKFKSTESIIGAENVVMALMWNMASLKVNGDSNQKI